MAVGGERLVHYKSERAALPGCVVEYPGQAQVEDKPGGDTPRAAAGRSSM